MTRHLLLTAAAALALSACGERANNNEQANTGAGAAGTTQTETGMTGPNPAGTAAPTVGQSSGVNAAEDAVAGVVGQASAAAANSVDGFVTAAAMSDMFEIESSKLALTKATSPAVKKYAQQMIDDHTKTTAQLKKIIADGKLAIVPPTQLDNRRQGMIDNLKAATGAAFDEAYVDQQEAAHKEAVTLMNSYVDDGDNAALKQFAQATAPKIQMHHDMAEKLDD